MERVDTLFLEMAPFFSEGIIICDKNSMIIYANEKISESLGFQSGDLIGKMCFKALLPEEFYQYNAPQLEERNKGVTLHFEAPIIKNDSSTLWCSVTTIPEFDTDGNFRGSINIIKDHSPIHDEQLKLDRLRKLHEGFYKLNQIHTRGYNLKQISLTILEILVATLDINVARIYKVSWSDDQMILDLEADKMKFKTIDELSEFFPEGISKVIPNVSPGSIYEQVIESAEPQFIGTYQGISEKFLVDSKEPVNLIHKTIFERMIIESYFLFPIVHFNETVYLIECISEHQLERGQVDDLHTLLTNVGNLIDRKLSEIDLQRSEKRWRELIENSSEITCIIDADGIVKFISQPVYTLMGYNVNEVKGRDILEFVHDEDRDVARAALLRRINEGGKGGFTIYRFLCKKPLCSWLNCKYFLVH
jgi:PAS domain S-box-containing protein